MAIKPSNDKMADYDNKRQKSQCVLSIKTKFLIMRRGLSFTRNDTWMSIPIRTVVSSTKGRFEHIPSRLRG